MKVKLVLPDPPNGDIEPAFCCGLIACGILLD